MKKAIPIIIALAMGCAGSPPADESREPEFTGTGGQEEPRCSRIVEQHSCPDGAEIESRLTMLSEEGSLFCEVECVEDGEREGPYVLENVSTRGMRIVGQFKDGKQHGEWTRTSRNQCTGDACPIVARVENYRDGKLEGPFLTRAADGSLRETGSYVDGAKHGTWITHDENGNVARRYDYKMGKPIGTHKYFLEDGQPLRVERYDDQGRPDGEWCYYDASGNEVDCFEMKAGAGVLKHYDPRGELVKVEPMKDGEPHGVVQTFTYGGQLVSEIAYEAGELHGVSKYYRNDCLHEEVTYDQGVRSGPYEEYACQSESIQDRTSGQYCQDEKCGTWTREWEETVHIQRYNQRGRLVGEEIYQDAELVESWDAETLKAEEHQQCLDALANGGCCDPEQNPPKGYKRCVNGQRGDSGD